ncbi:MAG: ATP synthase subunit C [Candidatus Jordarchaeales archaeon]
MVNVPLKRMILIQIAAALLAVALAYATSLVLAQIPSYITLMEPSLESGLGKLGAGVAIGIAGLGAGIGMGTAGAAAIGAIAERPEVFGRTMIYIVFIEAIAIYALVIAFMVM